jgi:WD40 repeat protein
VNEGRTIVTCSADQTIRLWDIESGKALKTLKGHRAEIRGMVAIQGGKELVSGGFDGLLKVWDLEQDPEKNQHMVIPLPTFEPVKGVIPPVIDRWAFSADSQTIITMDNDANLIGISGRFFDRKSNIASLGEGIRGGAFSPDRLKFGSIDQDGDVFIWDLKTMHPEPQWVGQFDNSMPIGFRDKNQELVMLTQTPQNNEILLVHSKDGTIRSRIALKDKVVPHHLSQSGRWLFANVLSDGGNGQLFDLNHPEIESFNLSAASKNIGVYASSISPDDRFIITPAEPHLIRIFQIPARNPIKEMTAHLNGAKSIGFSPDSLRMVSGAAGRDAFKLWDVKTWRCLLTLPSDGQFWTRTQFSKDGNLIGSMGIDRESLHIWWAPSWDEIETMEQEVLNSRGNH